MDYGFLSLIPPIVAIVLAFKCRNVFIALFTAMFLGCFILAGGNPIAAIQVLFDMMVGVFEKGNNVKSIFAILIVGGMIYLIEQIGGVDGLIRSLVQKRSVIKSKRGALLLTWLIGVLVFTTGGMSILVTGTVSTPICKAMKIAPEKNALVVHATSSPVTVMIPFSAMGAFTIGYLGSMAAEHGASVNIYYESLPFMFTPIIFILGTLFVILTGFDFKEMKERIAIYERSIENDQEQGNQHVREDGKAIYLILPMVLLVSGTFAYMTISGNGNFLKGDGMTGFLFAAVIALGSVVVMALKDKRLNLDQLSGHFMKGCGDMMPIATILTFAYTFSTIAGTLGTGTYLGRMVGDFLPNAFLPAIIYLIAAAISMSTGSLAAASNVIVPIALPMAVAMGVNLPLVIGAVYSGATLGDCASMISDNTILTCSTTKCDVMNHIKTQMPYAIVNFCISISIYLVLGFVM